MQSGKAAAEKWIVEYEPATRPTADPLMGYNSSADMRRQIRLEFDTREEAIAYAERNAIPFRVLDDHKAERQTISYADNFRYGRPQPWTH